MIKKEFSVLMALLEENSSKKVSAIMPQLIELMSRKVAATNSRYNEEGELTHIFCYYHKEWESVTEVEYGKKASSITGLNTMCKEGASRWTRQQVLAKKAEANLLDLIQSGQLAVEDIAAAKLEIEEARKVIVPRG